jgi:hypothetical protein
VAERTADTVEGALQFAGLPGADVRRRSQTWAEMLVRPADRPKRFSSRRDGTHARAPGVRTSVVSVRPVGVVEK